MKPKICPTCKIEFKSYNKTCSVSCGAINSKQKREETYFLKTGYTNPSHNPEVKSKISTSNKANAVSSLEVRKKTNVEKYGVEFLLQTEEYKQKAKDTTQANYGVDNIFQIEGFNKLYPYVATPEQKLKTKIKRFETDYLKGMYHYPDSIRLFTKDDWELDITERKYLCLECNQEFLRYSSNVYRCTHCFPINFNKGESEVFNFCQSIYDGTILRTDRQTIAPRELDIHIPDKKLAIEYDGLLLHSYGDGKDFKWSIVNNLDKENVKYHLQKTEQCKELDTLLLHIFENEWLNPVKQNIWKSIIQTKLGGNRTIGARQCELNGMTKEIVREFLNKNHLQGECNSSVEIGLFYEGDLVSLLTLSKPRFNKNYDWEIVRFCNKIGWNISGGFSRLLKEFRKNYSGSIITYADKRYSDGALYRSNSFVELPDSKPNYWYCHPRKGTLESRLEYQKHKLKEKLSIYNEELTEAENMFMNGYRRIWDCGNKVFVLT
jgi:hypothetical protein